MDGQSHDDGGGPPVAPRSSRVEVRDQGGTASADVTTPDEPHSTATVAFRSRPGDVAPEARRELVDKVLAQPEVQGSDAVHVVLPLGDGATIGRLHERTTNVDARAAGASTVIDAEVPETPPPG